MSFTVDQLFWGFQLYAINCTMRRRVGPDVSIQEWSNLPEKEQRVWIAMGAGLLVDHMEPTPDLAEALKWVTEAWNAGKAS